VAAKLDAVRAAQADGVIDPGMDPADVYSLVISLSMTWSPAATVIAAAPDDAAADHGRRRDALRVAVRRAFRPDP
jgi:Tetracyclin repressor-like, C-terminal domain